MGEIERKPLERTAFPLGNKIPDESVPRDTTVQLVCLHKGEKDKHFRIRAVVEGEKFGPWISHQTFGLDGTPIGYRPYTLRARKQALDICSMHGWIPEGED